MPPPKTIIAWVVRVKFNFSGCLNCFQAAFSFMIAVFFSKEIGL